MTADSLGDITTPYAGAAFDHQGSMLAPPRVATAGKDGGLTPVPSLGQGVSQGGVRGEGSRAQTYSPRRWETDSDWGGSLPRAALRRGVQQFRHRAYDPKSARWLQEDPIGPPGGSLSRAAQRRRDHLYRYNNGNPVSFSDPFGMCPLWPECMFQWMADQAARHGGVSGSVALNVAAGLNAASEAIGLNDLGASIGRGDVLGTAVAAVGILPVGKATKASKLNRAMQSSSVVASEDAILRAAANWVGPAYRDLGNGVYRSADNLRQFRMAPRDLPHQFSHVHFEYFKQGSDRVYNVHMYIKRE